MDTIDEYKIFLGSPEAKEGVPSTRVGTEETPERSEMRDQTSTSSFNLTESYNFDMPYFNQQQPYYKYQEQFPREQTQQPIDRRRRYTNQ